MFLIIFSIKMYFRRASINLNYLLLCFPNKYFLKIYYWKERLPLWKSFFGFKNRKFMGKNVTD